MCLYITFILSHVTTIVITDDDNNSPSFPPLCNNRSVYFVDYRIPGVTIILA